MVMMAQEPQIQELRARLMAEPGIARGGAILAVEVVAEAEAAAVQAVNQQVAVEAAATDCVSSAARLV